MKIGLSYLAAGNSRRFGSKKLLYQWNGKPMYLHLLERLMEIADADDRYELLAVTRYEEIQKQISTFLQEGRRIACVWSPESEKGVSYSIRSGLFGSGVQEGRASEAKMQACAFFVADQPWLAKESVLGFLERMQKEEARLGCVKNGSLLGNPVWFSQEYFGELLELQGDEGGKKVFRRHQEEAVYYEIENGKELEDIDRLRYNSSIKR